MTAEPEHWTHEDDLADARENVARGRLRRDSADPGRPKAVAKIILDWWERELIRLEHEGRASLVHNGRAYAADAGRC